MPRTAGLNPNLAAFLDMIAVSEGTVKYGNDDGYDVIVGGTTFSSYADHPRKLVKIRPGLSSTAAGRYQLLSRYWDHYRKQLGLNDFSPESQDAVAIQQLREQKSIQPIEAGQFEEAVRRCRNIWASLPGAGYSQHENDIDDLRLAYMAAGGTLA